MPAPQHPSLELKIDNTAFGGKGVARHEGKVFFVEDALEGDVVLAQILEDNDRYATAKAVEIRSPSPWRGPSPCKFSHECGGCQWQGVPYEQQLVWKKSFITNALQRIGKLGSDLNCEILGSPSAQEYRNRIMVRGRLQTDGRIVVGYFRRGSRDFVAIDTCKIASPRLNAFIERISALKLDPAPSEEIRFRFEMQDLPSIAANDPHLLLSVYEPDQGGVTANDLVRELKKAGGVLWAGSVRDLHKADFVRFETDLGIDFHTAAGLFQQVNIPHNHVARRLVLDTVSRLKPSNVLDIFCGSGNLSLAIAKLGIPVKGVEFSKRAIEAAAFNCKENNITNAEYFSGDTEKFLWRASKANENYDLVIADPPREGMFKALIPLKNLAPKYIIYVSCDPTTLARDLGSLCKKDYRIIELKALDFFPNTYHIESFVVLERVTP